MIKKKKKHNDYHKGCIVSMEVQKSFPKRINLKDIKTLQSIQLGTASKI